ncbi:MAG: aminotransferase [Acidimicrobiales bacterium]|nr:aminotransferase [Acidimicrobiales bacterium]MYD81862.1 aminotransferase [Acidimicrobiales bacterium]MYJ63960.1 aminotransferase [Acidimicrobiales bacterium]
MRALVITHEETSRPGFVGDRLVERGVELHVHVMVPDTSRPADFHPLPSDHFDVLVVTGSYFSVYEDAIKPWIGTELDLIRRSHDNGTPVLGICFGGQALAAALGGSVDRSPETEIGWYRISAPDGIELPISAGPWMEWHHDRFHLPDGAELLASTEICPQLFRMGRSVGTQFHPEIRTELASEWLYAASDDYLASVGIVREEILAEVARNEAANRRNCFDLVDWFLDDVAKS